MGSNAVLQGAFKDAETGKVSNHGRLISGFGAGVLEALVIVTPFEVSAFVFKFSIANDIYIYFLGILWLFECGLDLCRGFQLIILEKLKIFICGFLYALAIVA